MITETRESLHSANLGLVRETILVDIPKSDIILFQMFANKLGWQYNSRQNLWDKYIKSSPENSDLSEEEIIEEVRAIRYGKIQDNN